MDVDDDRARRLEYWMKELAIAERKAAETPQDTEAQHKLGRICYQMHLYEKARPALEAAANDSRRLPSVLTYFGLMHMKEGHFDLALRDFGQAEEHIVSLSARQDLKYHRMKCLIQLGRHGDAERLKKELEGDEDNPSA
jgi:tetratricopeptide (TPR) repeat protein